MRENIAFTSLPGLLIVLLAILPAVCSLVLRSGVNQRNTCRRRRQFVVGDQASGNQMAVASGHLFYLAYTNLGNFQPGQKGELRQRYKNAPNYPPASARVAAIPGGIRLDNATTLK